jgi:cytochrome c oxidase subunit II
VRAPPGPGCWLAIAPSLMLAGCTGWQSTLDAQGASAIDIKHHIVLIVAVCSAVWALVMVVLIGALGRSRGYARPVDPDPVVERRLTRAVVAAMTATIVIITAFTMAAFFTTRALSVAGQDDLTIKVRGQQWWWDVEYFGAASDRRFTTANEIHVPVGVNVRFLLESVDVIHSFWVPSLAGKQDLIPGRRNEITVRAERPGVYRGQCAEFCGLQHAHMALLIVAEERAAFDQWLRSQQVSASQPSSPEAAAGEQVFLSRPCAACHTIRGTSAAGTTGPDLTHVGGRMYVAAGLLETTRGSLAAWIADPQTLKPGNNMPMVPLSADELRAISAYLAGLK